MIQRKSDTGSFHSLSLENINKVSPCKVEEVTTAVYVFHTKGGVVYSVSFKEDMEIAGYQTFQFILERISDKQGFDAEVRYTVIAIINEFFAQNNEILLYICDTTDGREAARNRLFLRWFSESDTQNNFEIKAADTQVEGEGIFFAIIFKKSNPKADIINTEFDETATYLTSK